MIILCLCVLFLPVCFSLPLSGWVSSPGHPGGYEPHSKMAWERCAPEGHTLTLSIIHLDLEDSVQCENDAVKVYADSVLLKTLCGRISSEQLQSTVNPLLHSSPGGCLSLSFKADYSNTERHTGFRAFYTVKDVDECWESDVQCSHFCHNFIGGYSCSCKPGYYLSEDRQTCTVNCTEERFGPGVLTPPGSPGPYFENAQCSYTLSVEEGEQIILNFTGEFDVESRDGQCVDSLTIKAGSKTFGPFCGQNVPAAINTGAQSVEVLFNTDQGGANQGFTLHYNTKVMECPATVTADSIVSPQKDVYVRGDIVTVQCVPGYTLENTIDKTFESECQRNGMWSPVSHCKPVDCGIPEFIDSDLMALTEKDPLTTYRQNISIKCLSQYYQLVGNEHFSCSADGQWESNGEYISTQKDVPKCIPVCGKNKETFSFGRVFGGRNASLEQIPWQLLKRHSPRGGASLINDRWAITAAHVVDGYESKPLVFFGGMVDGQDQNAVQLETEKIIIHPGFEKKNPARKNFDHDIALMKMSKRVPLSPKIMPVCLPQKSNGPVMQGRMGTVSGFGATEQRLRSRFLQYGHVEEYSEVPCFETDLKVTDNMFCAGAEGVDSCKGDSGGPLVVPEIGERLHETPFQIKGIVSWGPPICGDKNFKGYYTKVENYLDWIKETMENNVLAAAIPWEHESMPADNGRVRQRYRRIPPSDYDAVKAHIQLLLKNQVIQESCSPYASPIVLVRSLLYLYISTMGRIKLIVSLLWMSLCECKVAMYGHLQSPMFPEPYSSDLHMRWYLKVPHGYQIQLIFIHVDIQPSANCTKDSLTIKAGSKTFGPFCGQNVPAAINTAAQSVEVLFNTEQGGINQGFKLHYSTKVMECPETVTTDSIVSPQKDVYVTGDTVTVQCVPGYTLENTIDKTFESECQSNGMWSPVSHCKPVDCGIPEFIDSDLMALTEKDPLTTYRQNITIKCLSQYYQLVGNEHFSCNADGHWESNGEYISTQKNLPKCIPVCGKNKETFSFGSVFGGRNASLGQIPWQLLKKHFPRGGASLITDRWAITAAHVVDDFESKSLVFLGGMVDGQDQNAVQLETEKIIIHPGFEKKNYSRKNYNHDIALMKMSKRVPLSPKIMPVCLPQKSNGPVMQGRMGTISGFGATEHRLVSRFLQYGHVEEYTEVPCFKTDLKVTDNMFCAGADGVDSCKGDSGGPLVIPEIGERIHEAPFQIKGIVSWGPLVCGDENFRRYYTKVENYLDWIREMMENKYGEWCLNGPCSGLPSWKQLHVVVVKSLLVPVMAVNQEPVDGHRRRKKAVTVAVAEAKSRAWEEFGEAMENDLRAASKRFWKTLRQLRRGRCDTVQAVLSKEGQSLNSTERTVGHWKKHFEELLNPRDMPPVQETIEGVWLFATPLYTCFVDLEKSYVPREILWEVLQEYGVPGLLRQAESVKVVRASEEDASWTHPTGGIPGTSNWKEAPGLLWMSLCECKVAMYGHLQSPMFPEPYSSDLHMRWYLKVPHGYKIQLTFIHVDIQPSANCTKDSLTIKAGSKTFGPFCGQNVPAAINTAAQSVEVLFNTEQGGINQGFKLHYSAKVMECPETVTTDSIVSPQKDVYVTGDTVTVQCVPGYTLKNTTDKTFESECQRNETWSPISDCKPVDCGIPKFIDSDLMALTEKDPLTTYRQNISIKCLSQYYQLVGNEHFSCNADGQWESNGEYISTQKDVPKCIPVCGKNKETFSFGSVFGGRNASLGQIPWQLLKRQSPRGGASLINDRWAITSAHVVDGYESKSLVFLGGMVDGHDQNAVQLETEKIIIHPGFEKKNPARKNLDHDIALMKMSKRVPLSPKIMPVCLPQKSNGPVMQGRMGTISGFGATEQRLRSRFLKYGHVEEYSEVPCFKTDLKVTDNMFCAGADGVDSCKGDAGGPLVIPEIGERLHETPFQIKGIVSWGPLVCGDKNFKGYYTKVENYLDWIKETMENN
ncbi:ovochymase-like [Hoplias malabaricus]|uniref:ovochymase-like n=1 Tax=Hoplias malabaricus TaxID=27720 RepID=UPI003462863F